MLISPRDSLLVIIMLSSALLLVIAAGVSLALKFKQHHSTPYLLSSFFLLFQSVGILGILLRTILNSRINAHFDTLLKPTSLITGFLTLFFILAYIIEIKRPGKITLKNCLLGLLPVILLSVTLFFIPISPIHSPMELFEGINHPDIILRLLIILCFIIYPVFIVCLPYEWRQCLVSRKTIAVLHILSCLIPPAFIAGLTCGFFPAVLLNYILAITLDTLVVYIEFKIRIPVTEPIWDSSIKSQGEESILDSPEIWMNPDITATELARIMGTNHTYLLNRIKKLGYLNYSDMINRKRVEYICKNLEKGTDVNIISLMFEAGFRSRSTASREFKRIVGRTPSEYQESVLPSKKTSRSEPRS